MAEVVELNRTMKEIEEKEQKKNDNNDNGGDGDGDHCKEVVRWERYLPRMVLTVLLVEADHSTRQIITALLKKCSYRVIAVSDGLKAWETLKKKAPDLDLILTEVDLPAISGFALLSLIMEHDICKNIPVIMMSSQDSVSMVLKCMLKGAADFLIKPVRRNELTNLWQHVWRRHASSGVLQNTTFPQDKLKTATEDNSASNQSGDFVASSQKNNECSEKLSEAQSTCASPILEAENAYSENMQNASQRNIDVVKHEEIDKFERESTKHDDDKGEKSITFALEAAGCNKTFNFTDLRLEQEHGAAQTENKDEIFRAELSGDNSNINTEIHGCSDELIEHSSRAIDLIATFENLHKHAKENCRDGCNEPKFDFDTRLGLSLRRDFPGSSCKQACEATEEWHRLNHSNTSAFSRYSGSKLLQPHLLNSNWDSSESHKSSGITASDCCHNGDSNKTEEENMTTAVISQHGQAGSKLSNSDTSSVFHAESVIHHVWTPKPVCQKESSPFPSSTSSHSNPESHNSDQHHHPCSDDANYTCLNQNLDHSRYDSPTSGQIVDNDSCHALNHINSRTYRCIGNGNDGNATSIMVVKNNLESFSDSGCYNYDVFRLIDSHRSSQREAALTKFRLKRKERCFEKKVRYQSRKRLAEQRPRVKGQFVRQVHNDHPVADHPVADASGDP